MSHQTADTRESPTDYRALIARIDDTMAALERERRRLEERAAESPAAQAAPETRRER